nr:alpha/beta fold hydrolase [Kofleriaceae bacterium]
MKRAIVIICFAACHQDAPAPSPNPPATPPSPPAQQAPAQPGPKLPAPPMPAIAGVAPVEADFTRRDVTLSDGEKLGELRIHYTTYGTPARDAAGHVTNAVLVMHGTTGSGAQFTRPQFAGELFGPGQPLDLKTHYVILPDDIGHGRSSKPSDGLRARFPHYGYADMVAAEHALVVDGLHVDHLKLVMGTSMGCMHAWMWAEQWPAMMDAVMPLACLPTQIAGRNRMWRKLLIDVVRDDPAYANGDYTTEPVAGLQGASAIFDIASSAPLADQVRMPTRDAADKVVETITPKFVASHDANDLVYQVASSADYDPSKDLEKITARVTAVNSADDFINPPELGIAETMIKRVAHGKFVLIPASPQTHGHGTHTWAALWKSELVELLK